MENSQIEIAKKFGVCLPEKIEEYPKILYPWFLDFGKRANEQRSKKLDVPKNLLLIAEGTFLFGLQLRYENEMKTRALGVIMRDRLLRAREENKWLSGQPSIQVLSIQKQ
jgi:hypothetical protein